MKTKRKKKQVLPEGIKTDKSIAQIIKEYIDSDGPIVTCRGTFSGKDFNDLVSVLNGTADNFLIFDNAGGRPFHIWIYDKKRFKGTLNGFEQFIIKQIGYVYMCKIKGKETVFRMLPNYHKGGFGDSKREVYK